MSVTRSRYYLVAENTRAANNAGLSAGDVVVVPLHGQPVILRADAYAPPVGIRARLEAEGALVLLEPSPLSVTLP